MENVRFYAKETTGSIGEQKPNTTREETTGSIGYKVFDEPIPNIDRTPEKDSVCFKGYDYDNYNQEKKHSAFATILGVGGGVILAVVGLGYLHKANAAGKITNESFKKFADKINTVTEPCHKFCSKIKELATKGYNKVKDFLNKKK